MNEDVKVSFSETGARTVKRNIDSIAESSERAQLAVDSFKASLKFGTNNASLRSLSNALTLLKAELAGLTHAAGVVRTLRTELATLQNAGTFLKNLVSAMTGLHAASANLTSFTKTLQQISTHAGTLDLVTNALNKLAASLPTLVTFKAELTSIVAMTPQVQALAAALRSLGNIKTDIRDLSNASKQLAKDIEAAAKHAKNAQSHISQMGGSSVTASQGLWALRHSLAGVVAFLVVSKVREWLDAWQSAAGLFKIATDSMDQMVQVQERIVQLAKDTRQEFTPMAELYTRLERTADNLGASQTRMINFTKGVATALAIQHTSATQARGALMQLGQAMALGRVRAQEYNSINENLPVVLLTVAKNIKGVDGNIGKLRQKMLAGQLTAKEFFEAFSRGIDTLAADFAKTTVTISQAFTVANTNFTAYLGKLDDAIGFSDKFGKAVIFLTSQLDILVPAIVAVGIALLGAFGPAVMGIVMPALKSFHALLLANPFAVFVASVAGISLYMAGAADQIEIGSGAVIEFNKRCIVVKATVADVFTAIKQDISKAMTTVGQVVDSAATTVLISLAQIGHKAGLVGDDLGKAFDKDFGEGWGGFLNKILFALDLAFTAIKITGMKIVAFFDVIGENAGAAFGYALNVAIQKPLETAADGVISVANKLRSWAGKDPIVLKAELPDIAVPPDFAEKLKTTLDGIADDAFAQMDKNGLLAYSKGISARVLEIAKARRLAELKAEQELNAERPGFGIIDPNADKEAQRAADRLRKEFEKIQAVVDPIASAKRQMLEDEKVIAEYAAKFKWSSAQTAAYTEAIRSHYAAAADPLKALNDEHEKEMGFLKTTPAIRKTEEEVTKRILELRKQMGVQAQIDENSIRAQVKLREKEARIASAREQIYGQTVGERKDSTARREAVGRELNDEKSDFGIGDARKFWMNEQPDLFAGTHEQMEMFKVEWLQMYKDIDAMRQQNVISAQTESAMIAKVKRKEKEATLNAAVEGFDNLATLTQSKNRDLARIGKAAAIASATIKGYEAVQNALATPLPWPIPQALAATAAAAAAVNVANIASTPIGFMTGGEFTVGGRGGADSQMVAFRASPGERVQVQTPEQYRKGNPNDTQAQPQQTPMNIRIVNIQDKRLVGDYLSTSEGERLILNVLEKNPAAVKRISMR